jgi:hypothetical protein
VPTWLLAGACVLLLLGVGIAVFRFRQQIFGANAIQTKGETGVYKIPLRVYMNAQFFFWIKICGG